METQEWKKAEESELGGAAVNSSLINYVCVSIWGTVKDEA